MKAKRKVQVNRAEFLKNKAIYKFCVNRIINFQMYDDSIMKNHTRPHFEIRGKNEFITDLYTLGDKVTKYIFAITKLPRVHSGATYVRYTVKVGNKLLKVEDACYRDCDASGKYRLLGSCVSAYITDTMYDRLKNHTLKLKISASVRKTTKDKYQASVIHGDYLYRG